MPANPVGGGMVIVFGFDNREGNMGLVVEDVASAFYGTAFCFLATYKHAPVGERDRLLHLQHSVPAGDHNCRSNELRANVLYRK